MAGQHAKALGAELIRLRVIPAPRKVGVIAELIATDRPVEKAQEQINAAVAQLTEQGVNASGLVKVGEVAPGIVSVALELNVDLLFVGTTNIERKPFFLMEKDPIVHYLVDKCPIPLCLVRHDIPPEEPEEHA